MRHIVVLILVLGLFNLSYAPNNNTSIQSDDFFDSKLDDNFYTALQLLSNNANDHQISSGFSHVKTNITKDTIVQIFHSLKNKNYDYTVKYYNFNWKFDKKDTHIIDDGEYKDIVTFRLGVSCT